MLRKKIPSKSSAKTTKQPIALEIKAHHAPASPHVLNLRPAPPAPQPHLHQPTSLDKRVAVFDERLREVPDLLKAREDTLATFWREEQKEWEETSASFFDRLLGWGAQVRGRLQEKHRTRKTRATRARRTQPVAAQPSAQIHSTFYILHSSFPHFLVLLVLLTLPLQTLAVYRAVSDAKDRAAQEWSEAQKTLGSLPAALLSGNFKDAEAALAKGRQHLKALTSIVDRAGPLRRLLPKRLEVAHAALTLADHGAAAAETILSEAGATPPGSVKLGRLLHATKQELTRLLSAISPFLDEKPLNTTLNTIVPKLLAARDLTQLGGAIMGSDTPSRLLLIFQNPRELRATGGFAGSFALLTVQDGKLISIETPPGGTYAVQGQLKLLHLAPRPLQIINPRFEFQDANWWPNFPDSAQKIAELYEAAGGPTLDAVVAITASAGEDLLRITGPLASTEGTISADNFIDVLQETITRDRALNRATPKKIITHLLPAMADALRAAGKEHPTKLGAAVLRALARKDIQLWARADDAQGAIRRLGWSGELTETQGDYLAVVRSNVGGGKTDAVVEEEISHEVRLQADRGILRETLRIRRTHHGTKGDRFIGLRNISYLRIYVPEGARFLTAQGFTAPPSSWFEEASAELTPDPEVRLYETQRTTDAQSGTEIWREAGKTVFGNFLIVEPGQSQEATLTYEVPINTDSPTIPYTLTVDRQAGAQVHFVSRLILEDGLKVLTGTPQHTIHPDGWTISNTLEENFVTSALLQKL